MQEKRRSGCPISFALDLFGDKWSLLIMRDLLFLGKKNYGEFLNSEEGISTNILASRLEQLERHDLISKTGDPENKKKHVYSPTKKALDLIPMLLEMIKWSAKYDPKTAAPASFTKRIEQDREKLIAECRMQFRKLK